MLIAIINHEMCSDRCCRFFSAAIYSKLASHSIEWYQMLVSEVIYLFIFKRGTDHGTGLIPDTGIGIDGQYSEFDFKQFFFLSRSLYSFKDITFFCKHKLWEDE